MRLTVRLFALAKQRVGSGTVPIDLPEGATVAHLRRALAEHYPALAPLAPRVMIAVGAEYASDDRTIESGADVAVIPPVSGGSPKTTLPARTDP